MNYRNLIASVVMITGLFAQSIVGVVTGGNKPLAGANIVIDGTNVGTVSSEDGTYILDVEPLGMMSITASFIGYSPVTKQVTVGDGSIDPANVNVDFVLEVNVVALSALEVWLLVLMKRHLLLTLRWIKPKWKFVLVHKTYRWL